MLVGGSPRHGAITQWNTAPSGPNRSEPFRARRAQIDANVMNSGAIARAPCPAAGTLPGIGRAAGAAPGA